MDIYSHVLPSMHEDAMDRLNQAFSDLDEDEEDDDDNKGGGVLARK